MEAAPRGRLVGLLDDEVEAARSLKARGFAVVRVCDEGRAAELAAGVWSDLERLGTGISRNDPATWTNERWPQTTHGLLQNQQFGLREGVCEARLETWAAWERLFGGRRVVSSFDAVSVCRPESQERSFAFEERYQRAKGERVMLSSWLHTDQAKGKAQCLEFIQGAFALTELGSAEQRTQLVVPRVGESAQSFRDRFVRAFPAVGVAKGKTDPEREEWVKHTDDERAWLLREGEVVTPELRAGEMLLWDSGLPHASVAGRVAAGGGGRRVRISVFVSAVPLSLVEPADLAVRRAMLESGDTSGHRVTTRGVKKAYLACKFGKTGRTYGKEVAAYSTDGVVRGMKRAWEGGEESVAARTARMCGGY